MAEFPALPLWTDAYLGDTTHLTTIEHGAYLLLLMTAWRTRGCALPDDDRLLARYARLSAQQWKRMRPIIAAFFIVENGVWRQGRLTDERDAVERHRRLQSEKGKAGALAKSLKKNGRHKAGAKSGLTPAKAEVQPDASSLLHTHNTVDKSTAASAADLNDPESENFDPAKALFDDGIRVLGACGVKEGRARSLIGRWRKQYTDEPVALAIAAAESRDISQPLEWIPKWLETRASRSGSAPAANRDFLDVVKNELAQEEAAAART